MDIRLSAEQLLVCMSDAFHSLPEIPCSGGDPFLALYYIRLFGLVKEEFYKYRTRVIINF